MSYGAICKYCRHWTTEHDANGKCHFSHQNVNSDAECECSTYELLPGSDFDPFVDKVCDGIDDARRKGLLT